MRSEEYLTTSDEARGLELEGAGEDGILGWVGDTRGLDGGSLRATVVLGVV